MGFIGQILYAGIESDSDDSLTKEKRIFYAFLLGSIVIIAPLTIINTIKGNWFNSSIGYGIIAGLLILLVGLRHTYYQVAKHVFIYLCLLAICLSTYYNFTQLRFTGVKDLMFPLILAAILLFRTRTNVLQTLLITTCLFSLHFIQRTYEQLPFDSEFTIRLIIAGMNISAIFILAQIYKFNEKELVRKMVKQKDMLYALIDHVPVMMSLIDREKRYKLLNLPFAEGLKLNREEMTGAKAEDILPKELFKKHEPWFDQATQKGPVVFNEKIKLGGQKYFFTGKYVPIKNKEGEVEFISQYLVDITTLKQTEASLKEANDAKNKLLSIIAHDLRSPLAMLSTTMELDKQNQLTDEEFVMVKNEINEKLKNLIYSLNTTLEWSKYQLEGLKAAKSLVDLNSLIQECIQIHEDFAKEKGIQIQILGNDYYQVWADPNHLRLVFRNLLHNALKFSKKGDTVTFSAKESNGMISVNVSDKGIGMTEKQIHDILSGSIQHSNPGTQGEVGTGLGLSLSLSLLNLDELSYTIKSKPGEGTQFDILMPKSCANQNHLVIN